MPSVGSTALAKILGISRQRVNALGRKGKIKRNADGTWDVDQVVAQLKRTLDPAQVARSNITQAATSTTDSDAPSPSADPFTSEGTASSQAHDAFNRARAAKEIAIARTRQLDLKRREGQYLDLHDVEHAWTAGLTALKNRLLILPDRLAPKVAVITNVLECRELIYNEVVVMLQVLSETKIDAKPAA